MDAFSQLSFPNVVKNLTVHAFFQKDYKKEIQLYVCIYHLRSKVSALFSI